MVRVIEIFFKGVAMVVTIKDGNMLFIAGKAIKSYCLGDLTQIRRLVEIELNRLYRLEYHKIMSQIWQLWASN